MNNQRLRDIQETEIISSLGSSGMGGSVVGKGTDMLPRKKNKKQSIKEMSTTSTFTQPLAKSPSTHKSTSAVGQSTSPNHTPKRRFKTVRVLSSTKPVQTSSTTTGPQIKEDAPAMSVANAAVSPIAPPGAVDPGAQFALMKDRYKNRLHNKIARRRPPKMMGEESLLEFAKIAGTVYVMRHGQTAMDMGENRSDGWLDMPLTDEGRMHLIPAQQLLKSIPLSTIYAPNLRRTQETAEIVKSGVMSDPNVVIDPLARTWNLGVLAGVKKSQGRPRVKLLMSDPDTVPPGGESFNQFRQRFLPWFNDVVDKTIEAGSPVLLVLSGSNLRTLGKQILGGDERTIDLDEGGLAALHNVDGQWHVEVLLGHEDGSLYES
jgi:broad specificity phosphatase PhoE